MIRIIVLFFTVSITMLVMDYIWLGTLMKNVYLEEIGSILLLKEGQLTARMPQAALVYLVMVIGVLVLGNRHVTESNPEWKEILRTAFLGIVIFAVYDLTNYAVLSHWTWKIVILDTLWGGILFGTSRASIAAVERFIGWSDTRAVSV